MLDFEVIFDNAGGITVQTENYCHHFLGREKAAAKMVSELLRPEATTEGWDGNEPEHRLQYDFDVERLGGCKWVCSADLRTVIDTLPADNRAAWIENISGQAERLFCAELFTLLDVGLPCR